MNRMKRKNVVQILILSFFAILLAGSSSMAGGRWGGGGGRDYHGGGYRHGGGGYYHGGGGYYGDHFYVRGFDRHHYWGSFYIGPSWFWGPTVVVAGIPYYYYSGYYYTPAGDGLIVATPPTVATQTVAPAQTQSTEQPQAVAPTQPTTQPTEQPKVAQPQPAELPKAVVHGIDTVSINVPNSKGGFTPVILFKTEKGYIGPQGEFYPNHPTVAELKVLYGG
jgi:hypothetical protein